MTAIEHGRAAFWAAFLIVLLTGCASGLPDAQSPQERIIREAIRAQKVADAAELTSIDLLERRVIGSKEALTIADAAETVRVSAHVSRTLLAEDWNNTAGALSYLRAADVALQALDAFLTRHSRKVP